MLTEFAIIFALILANGVFSISELAVVSARKSRLKAAADQGDERAKTALAVADSPTRFLSTVQIGISLIGTLAAAFGGASLAERIAVWFRAIGPIAPYSYSIALALVVILISYLSLVFGELVPKRLALANAETVALAMAGPMQRLSNLVSPVVRVLGFSTDAILQLLGQRHAKASPVSEEDIRFMIEVGNQSGDVTASERNILERVFQLGDRRAWSVMKSRHEIVWLDLEDPIETNWQKILTAGFQRYPVCRGDLDALLGVVSLKDLLRMSHAGGPIDLTIGLQQPLIVPETKAALEILDFFKQRGVHIAMVVDEFGSIQGLITLGDILEALVGTIVSVGQPEEPEAVQREDGSWLFDGTLSVDELKSYLHLKSLPGEKEGYYQTLAGFILAQLGRIPVVGDHFVWSQLTFEVIDMDGHRIDKVLVTAKVRARSNGG